MSADAKAARIILLIEDNDADAALVSEYLASERGVAYDVHHERQLVDGLDRLDSLEADAILLDLRLPDVSGTEAVEMIRQRTEEVPIVVLTGLGDEAIALASIDAGAQDYLYKSDLKADALKRAIEYALARKRETELRELRQALAHYRRLGSEASATSVTARGAGVGSLRERLPAEFENCIGSYSRLLNAYVTKGREGEPAVRNAMQILVTRIGDCGGTAKDLIDLHTRVLAEFGEASDSRMHYALIVEGRLFALEMMGLLVDFYRVGRRSYFELESV